MPLQLIWYSDLHNASQTQYLWASSYAWSLNPWLCRVPWLCHRRSGRSCTCHYSHIQLQARHVCTALSTSSNQLHMCVHLYTHPAISHTCVWTLTNIQLPAKATASSHYLLLWKSHAHAHSQKHCISMRYQHQMYIKVRHIATFTAAIWLNVNLIAKPRASWHVWPCNL
jgi:hypothetical protein